MKDESQQQVPPGILAFKRNDGQIRAFNHPDPIDYAYWFKVNIDLGNTIHTISVENKEWSVGDETSYGKILRLIWHNDVWIADTEQRNDLYVKKLKPKPLEIVPVAEKDKSILYDALIEIQNRNYTGASYVASEALKAYHNSKLPPPSQQDRSVSQPGTKKLFYRLDFTDCGHDYNHTICRDMQEVQVYLICDGTGLGDNIEAGGDDDREPKVEIVGVWMTEGEYQQWGKDNSCDLTELHQPSQPGEGKDDPLDYTKWPDKKFDKLGRLIEEPNNDKPASLPEQADNAIKSLEFHFHRLAEYPSWIEIKAELSALRAESQAKDTRIRELWTDADIINAYWAGLDGAMGSDHDTEDYSPTGGANKWLTEYKKQLTK